MGKLENEHRIQWSNGQYRIDLSLYMHESAGV